MSGSRRQLAENLALPEFSEMVHNMVKNGSMSYFNEDASGNWFDRIVVLCHGLVAERFHIAERGVLKKGNYADIVILDRLKLKCFDETEDTQRAPEGIDYVLVNGKVVMTDGRITDVSVTAECSGCSIRCEMMRQNGV